MSTKALEVIRNNLFPSWLDGLLSVAIISVVAALFYAFAHWAMVQADWSVIGNSLRFMMAGALNITELWRAWMASTLFFFLLGLSLVRIAQSRTNRALLWVVVLLGLTVPGLWLIDFPFVALSTALLLAMACGWWLGARFLFGSAWLSLGWLAGTVIMWNVLVPSDGRAIGGLLLGVLITLVAAIASFPLGVLLALGRTSRLPGVRMTCAGYIELIRSLPLISILYWAWMVVPLILPGDLRINDLVRGAVGFTLFYAAYVAEYIRGGLQGVSEGQWNAARSLGLRKFHTLYYIILPQAIRSVLPGLVGNVLDIFNNVPLLFIIGLTEFVRAGQVVLSNPQHSNQLYEVYVFMFAVYLLIATVLSWSSRVVERNMGASN
ncbi:amino acid ABC transporter permease [Alcaligenaceae bacterium]|nr:amino acid ABC transporter permease [Alcaligenaceae bacterium]